MVDWVCLFAAAGILHPSSVFGTFLGTRASRAGWKTLVQADIELGLRQRVRVLGGSGFWHPSVSLAKKARLSERAGEWA